MRYAAILLLGSCFGVGCEADDPAKAKAAVHRTIDDASALAKEGAEATDKATAAVKEGSKTASEWAADLQRSSGELSATASRWIDEGAARAEGSGVTIESILASGKQVAPTALEIGTSLASAVDHDRLLEPIFQRIEPAGKDGAADTLRTSERADRAIAAMPRVEVIDGLTVGFRDLTSTTTGKRVSESGYLVIWRKGDYLVGFVYRSRQTIDIERLIADAPRLIALVRAVL
ncbi:MAG TPA: hypothetical protein ENK31_05150 [Nannocystis exedens]|nr:hypothetical protein [Nannocystis exedens]